MAETSWPFDNANMSEDQWTRLARLFADHGVTTLVGATPLVVSADGSGRQVFLAAGAAIVRGHYYSNDAVKTIAIAANSSGSTRIDRIVLQLDPTNNRILAVAKTGTPGSGPPGLTQTDTGIYEISLAQVTVANGAATISAGNVTLERIIVGKQPSAPDTIASILTPRTGEIAYDRTSNTLYVWNGANWCELIKRVGNSVVIASGTGGNFGLEIGPTVGPGGSTFLDLHSIGANPNDFDVRLQASGGTPGSNGQGIFDISASLVRHNGQALVRTDDARLSDPGAVTISGTLASGFGFGTTHSYSLIGGKVCELDLDISRTGADLFAGHSSENIADTPVITLPTGCRPRKTQYFAYNLGGTAGGYCSLSPAGVLQIETLSNNVTLSTGGQLHFTATYLV